MDDTALVRQVLAGQSEAYAELASRWLGPLVALCHALVGRADVADEVAQEVVLRGLDDLPSLSQPDRFAPWLASRAVSASHSTSGPWWPEAFPTLRQ